MPNYWLKTNSQYTRNIAPGGVFEIDLLERKEGYIVFQVKGKNAKRDFINEAGGHRFQRIPPTEKNGRRHTSTITIAVLEEPKSKEINIPKKDVEITAYRATGPGGQHRNKKDTAVRIKHLPTGIISSCETSKSQNDNREKAWILLKIKLKQLNEQKSTNKINKTRKKQLGSGMRGDKRRTIRMQDNKVVDHILNSKMKATKYIKGHLEELYENYANE